MGWKFFTKLRLPDLKTDIINLDIHRREKIQCERAHGVDRNIFMRGRVHGWSLMITVKKTKANIKLK